MESREIYLVIKEGVTTESDELGPAIRSTMVSSDNFKQAYRLALSLAEIARPTIGYRQALSRIQGELAIQLEDRIGPNRVIIAKIKNY
jgi:hypothetical protein